MPVNDCFGDRCWISLRVPARRTIEAAVVRYWLAVAGFIGVIAGPGLGVPGMTSKLARPGIRRFRSVTPSPPGVIRMAFLHRLEPVDGFQLG